MSYTIDQFGFKHYDQIPVKENDWTMLVKTFVESEEELVGREFEDSRKASNAAAAIRKASENLGAKVEVTNVDGTVFVQKA